MPVGGPAGRLSGGLAGALVLGLAGCGGPGPVPLPPDELVGDTDTCLRLVAALPDTLAGLERRQVVPPAAPAAAWGDPAVVVRCGVPEPTGFDRASPCLRVNGVDWFVPEGELEEPTGRVLTATVVLREVGVELVFPRDQWPPAPALAELSDVVRAEVPATGRCV